MSHGTVRGTCRRGKGSDLYHFRYTDTDTGIGYRSDTDSDRWLGNLIMLFQWITIKHIFIYVCFFLHFVFKKLEKQWLSQTLYIKECFQALTQWSNTAISDYSWKCMLNDPKTPISVQPQSKSKAVVPSGVRAWFWALLEGYSLNHKKLWKCFWHLSIGV